jgi:hypothetical protein
VLAIPGYPSFVGGTLPTLGTVIPEGSRPVDG